MWLLQESLVKVYVVQCQTPGCIDNIVKDDSECLTFIPFSAVLSSCTVKFASLSEFNLSSHLIWRNRENIQFWLELQRQ